MLVAYMNIKIQNGHLYLKISYTFAGLMCPCANIPSANNIVKTFITNHIYFCTNIIHIYFATQINY